MNIIFGITELTTGKGVSERSTEAAIGKECQVPRAMIKARRSGLRRKVIVMFNTFL
jgi:hypothetical protein